MRTSAFGLLFDGSKKPWLTLLLILTWSVISPAVVWGQIVSRAKRPEPQLPFEGSVWNYLAEREDNGEKIKRQGSFRLENKAFTPIRKRVGDQLVEKFDVQVNLVGFAGLYGGRAYISRENEDYWKGTYVDEKKDRWRFELRRGRDD